jgi:hypothetical protein
MKTGGSPMKNTHKAKNIFAGIAVVALAIVLSATLPLTGCSGGTTSPQSPDSIIPTPPPDGPTGPEVPTGGVITIAAIDGVTAPATGETPVTTITATEQYTGTVVWSPVHTVFRNSTIYFATITLTPQNGYFLEGVPTNFFTVAGANRVSNEANSNVVTAVFTTSRSIDDLESYLSTLPDNTAATPYFIRLKIGENNFSKLKTILNRMPGKYVYLDLSDSTFTSFPWYGRNSRKE